MLLDVPDFLIILVELLIIFPIIQIIFFVKFPEALPLFMTIVKKGNFVCSLGADNNLIIKPAKMRFDLWKVYSGIGKKATVIQEFESDPKDTIGLFGRPSILVRDSLTRAVDPNINKIISYMKNEMGLKTRQDFETAIKQAEYYKELMSTIADNGGYTDKDNKFVAISAEDFWRKLGPKIQTFLENYSKIEDGGLILNGLWAINIHDVEDYIDRHNPQAYAASEMYIEAKALTKGNSEMKKLLFLIIGLVGITLLAVLFMHGGGGAAPAAGVTNFVPIPGK